MDEIPAEHIKKNIPKGYGFSEKPRDLGFAYKAPAPEHKIAPPSKAPQISGPSAEKSAAGPDFAVGDGVVHKAFGPGRIVKLSPMGGDFLIEIDFEKLGVKKLMLRAAAQHMTKE